jgi:predicted metal-dependent HD superfamily phosphohydrolase
MKIRPVGAELFHEYRRMDRRTDMTKLIVAFLNFVYAPKNSSDSYACVHTMWQRTLIYKQAREDNSNKQNFLINGITFNAYSDV